MTIRSGGDAFLHGVLFDLFGTLIPPQRVRPSGIGPDTSDTFEEANTAGLIRWAAARELPTPPEAAAVIREVRGWLWAQTYATGRQYLTREALARAAPRLGWPQDAAFLEDASRAFFTAEVEMVSAYPDAVAALAALRDLGLRLALVSNASEHHLVTRVAARTGLAGFFDPVVSSAAFGRVKPDPGIFRSVLARWGARPERCVMVGDTVEADIGGAQAVGMRAVLVTMDPNPANTGPAARIRPDAVAESLEDVVAIIRRWAAPG